MRKILLGIITGLLTVFMILSIVKGINVGQYKVNGYSDIKKANEELEANIQKTEDAKTAYEAKLEEIKTSANQLSKAKKDYLDLVTVSTDKEIQQATQIKTYTIEYLWTEIGNLATKAGVNIKMDVQDATSNQNASSFSEYNKSLDNDGTSEYKNLFFGVTGNYLAMIEFMSSLENDQNLDFTIDAFSMQKHKCGFVVKDVKINKEETTVDSEKVEENKEKEEKKVNDNSDDPTKVRVTEKNRESVKNITP